MVLVFLGSGVETYELGAFLDVFAWDKNWGSKSIEVETVSLHDNIQCMGGAMSIVPDKKLEDIYISDYSALAIPGGFCDEGFFEDSFNEEFLEVIRQFDRQGKNIASICVGAMPLAKSGVLKNRKATTYKSDDNTRRNQLAEFGAIVLDQTLVVDDNIITSTGPSSGIHVALQLLEMLTDKQNRDRIAQMMGY